MSWVLPVKEDGIAGDTLRVLGIGAKSGILKFLYLVFNTVDIG